MVNTGKVTERRTLQYGSIDELLADVERIVAAEKAGKLRRTGNWTAGQALNHLAGWINFAYDGFPQKRRPPWFIRVLLKMKRNQFIHKHMDAGIRIPGVENGTFATEAVSTEEGADRVRRALARLKSAELARFDSPAWGPMTYEERVSLNLRHAELHLSFLHPA